MSSKCSRMGEDMGKIKFLVCILGAPTKRPKTKHPKTKRPNTKGPSSKTSQLQNVLTPKRPKPQNIPSLKTSQLQNDPTPKHPNSKTSQATKRPKPQNVPSPKTIILRIFLTTIANYYLKLLCFTLYIIKNLDKYIFIKHKQ
jgi:hypothetical protein